MKVKINEFELNEKDILGFMAVFKTTKKEHKFLVDALLEQGNFKDSETLEREIELKRMFHKMDV